MGHQRWSRDIRRPLGEVEIRDAEEGCDLVVLDAFSIRVRFFVLEEPAEVRVRDCSYDLGWFSAMSTRCVRAAAGC